MDDKEIVRLSNISYEKDGNTILKNISGTFFEKKITVIVGPSGSGKSTLLSLINGLKSHTAGEIMIGDKNIDSFNPIALRRDIQLVSQNATMINGSVKENLSLPLSLQNETMSDEEAKSFLEDVNLPTTFLNKDSRDLSGGEKQKLSLARALVSQPKIMLLDEVTSALDTHSKKAIESLLVKINQKHSVTMIWVTHDINQALSISDYVWLMMDGHIVESTETKNIKQSSNQYVKRFLGEDL